MSKAVKTLTNVLDTNYNLSKNFRDRWSNPDFASGPYRGPMKFSTDYSSVVDGKTTFDPSIRAMQDRFLSNNNDLRSRYMGNMSAFRQARLDPMRDQFGRRRSELQQSIGMRGLGGSSFGEQAINDFDSESQRELGNAAAIAESEDMNALNVLNANEMEVAKERFAQELAGLGLGQEQIQLMVGAFEQENQRKIAQMNAVSNMFNAQTNAVYGWIPAANGGGGGGGGGKG